MADLGSKAQASMGLTPGTRFFSPSPFAGMNTQSSATMIDDREFVYNENFIHLGDGKLRTNWDVGPVVYTVPVGLTLVSHYYYTIGSSYYAAIFLSDGSAVQLNTVTGVRLQIGPPGMFYNAANGQLPACAPWGAIYLLIGNRNTVNDYWAWDGAILYKAGGATPSGVNLASTGLKYNTLPTVTAFGGHGSGMTFTPFVQAGGVVNVKINNPGVGYTVGDIVQLAFSGGGSDSSPQLVARLTSGGVSAANITAAGTGYTGTPTVAFSGGGGSGAAGTVQIGSGVSSIAVTAGGTGYTSAPAITFTGGGGTGAAASATVVGGVVTAINVDVSGTGYTSAPTVVITGAGAGATATATIQSGIVTGITITSPGTNYTSAPTMVISGTGTGATAVAILSPSGVAGVTVVNGGTGFLYAPQVTFKGGGGAGAAGIVQLVGTSIARINIVAGGQNYSKVPTITFTGGNAGGFGGGAAGTAVIAGGQVVAINLTSGGSGYTTNVNVVITPFTDTKNPQNNDPGTGAGAIAIFQPTSIGSILLSNTGLNYTDAPAVIVSAGANSSAYATVSMMPFGVSGVAIETYQSRAWIANPAVLPYATIPPGGNFQVSAPGSFTDFATSDGGVLFTSSDGFLQTKYTQLKQANGYLYAFGDGSISVISSVNTAGSPTTTTFNYQAVDPDAGCSWRDSLTSFGRTLVFGNETGIYGLYGGAATKVSDKLNDIFDTAIFPPAAGALTPSAAVATIHEVKHYMMLITIADVVTGLPRNVMLTWNEREWFITSQTVPLTFIAEQKVNSKFTAWGTDGTNLYRLFNRPSATLTKTLWTKHFGGAQSSFLIKNLGNFYVVAQDQSVAQSGISLNVTFANSGIAVQSADPSEASVASGLYPALLYVNPTFQAPAPFWPLFGCGTGGAPFITTGVELTTTSPDFILAGLMISYVDVKADA